MSEFMGILGGNMIGQGWNSINRANDFRYQSDLMGIQDRYNKENMGLQHNYGKAMWDYTNFGNQVKHLTNAGLNVGLMYKGTGAGGQTTTPTGGSPKPGANPTNVSGQAMELGVKMALLKAQRENIESDTALKEAQAQKTSGVDTQEAEARTASLIQGIENQKAVEALTKVQTEYQGIRNDIEFATTEDQIAEAGGRARKAIEDAINIGLKNDLDRQTIDDKVKLMNEQAIGAGLQNLLTKSNIQVNEAKIKQITESIAQGWYSLELDQYRTTLEKANTDVNIHNAEQNRRRVIAEFVKIELTKELGYGALNNQNFQTIVNGTTGLLNNLPQSSTTSTYTTTHDGKGTKETFTESKKN